MSEEEITPKPIIKILYLSLGSVFIIGTISFLFIEETIKLGYTFLFLALLVSAIFETYRAYLNQRKGVLWTNILLTIGILIMLVLNFLFLD